MFLVYSDGYAPSFALCAVGVAYFTAASDPICLPILIRLAVLLAVPRDRLSLAAGVGHIDTAVAKPSPLVVLAPLRL